MTSDWSSFHGSYSLLIREPVTPSIQNSQILRANTQTFRCSTILRGTLSVKCLSRGRAAELCSSRNVRPSQRRLQLFPAAVADGRKVCQDTAGNRITRRDELEGGGRMARGGSVDLVIRMSKLLFCCGRLLLKVDIDISLSCVPVPAVTSYRWCFAGDQARVFEMLRLSAVIPNCLPAVHGTRGLSGLGTMRWEVIEGATGK